MKYAVRKGATVEIEIHDQIKFADRSVDLKRVKYTGVVSFEVVTGAAAAAIEAETDYSCIDDLHEYLVLHFADGEDATFRNSYVDMFII